MCILSVCEETLRTQSFLQTNGKSTVLFYVHIQKSPTLGRKPTNAEFMLPKMANLLCVHCVHIVSSI